MSEEKILCDKKRSKNDDNVDVAHLDEVYHKMISILDHLLGEDDVGEFEYSNDHTNKRYRITVTKIEVDDIEETLKLV